MCAENSTWASTCGCLDLLESSRRVLVQQAGDQGLVRESLRQCPLLDRLQVLARQSNIQPAILANVPLARVAGPFPLGTASGLPLTALDRPEQLLIGLRRSVGDRPRGSPPARSLRV